MRTPPSHLLRSLQQPTQATSSQGYDEGGLCALLAEARDAGASDVHFKVPGAPRMRVDGALMPTSRGRLGPSDTLQLSQTLLELAGRQVALATLTDFQIGFGLRGVGRFRAQIYRQRGTLGVAIHRMELDAPRLEQLGPDALVVGEAWSRPGLTLVAGRRERLTAIAALVDAYNRRYPGHLLSLEAPMEFLHRDERGAVAQREVGVDVDSVAAGLRVALLDDSDAIAVADLPDAESVELALRIAEAGRPVVAGVAGCQPALALRHLTRRFPAHRERELAERLSAQVRGVVWLDGEHLRQGFAGGR